jgi:hypothetical protein
MVDTNAVRLWLAGVTVCLLFGAGSAQQTGSIRGLVRDADFEAPLPRAQVRIYGTDRVTNATEEGTYLLSNVSAGKYTLVFSKQGYTRQVRSDVVVRPGQMTEVNASLSGDFAEMEEFVVEDVAVEGTEARMLEIRVDAADLRDSVSKEIMSAAGAGDAADAVKLVAGATIQDGKYAVIRGLPDRYVSSQMNGVRLPTADADKRAVQLDQFPSDVIQSVQISKTFTPDQQGDASGGAVNVVLKGIPEESILGFSIGYTVNTQVAENRGAFLTDKGGGVNCWGLNEGREIQEPGTDWGGAVGGSPTGAPQDYSWSVTGGGKYTFLNGLRLGAFGNFYYDRGASYRDNGIEDRYWVLEPGDEMSPSFSGEDDNQRRTSLNDVTVAAEEVQWGALTALGLEFEQHELTLVYMRTHVAENVVTLAQDTRGKEFFYPDYDPDDPTHPGNLERQDAPYLRSESIVYTERSTETLQLSGRHVLPLPEISIGYPYLGIDEFLTVLSPELSWIVSWNSASMDQPDKRLFAEAWLGPVFDLGNPFTPIDDKDLPAIHSTYKPSRLSSLGNINRIWREITETSDQYSVNFRVPFRQWTGHEGYVKFGVFRDRVHREFSQESFTNAGDDDPVQSWEGPWEERWSQRWLAEEHNLDAVEIDVDYTGDQEIKAWYHMVDLPLCRAVKIVGGARYETTKLEIMNQPEENAVWFSPDGQRSSLSGSEADVSFEQEDMLPSIGFVFTPFDQITIRGSRTETVARQTFKELTPIEQAEFLGADLFVGNPQLAMSSLKNYDLRFDYRPSPRSRSLVSVSWFHKDVTDPIEYVQRVTNTTHYTTPVNYPEGYLTGWEFEVRQDLGEWHDKLEGLAIGGNATIIESEVTLPKEEAEILADPLIQAPMPTRHMLNAPEHLYNLYMTYESVELGTKVGLFYTVRGDTLVAGAGQAETNFIPNVYETEYGTLNFTFAQKLNEHWTLKFKAKNLLDPEIQTVYRSEYIGDDVVRSSYRKGIDFSVSLGAEW